MQSELNLAILINAVDNASKVLGGVGSTVVGLGMAVIGTGAQAVKMAGDFQASMTSLVTGAGESQSNLQMVSDGILKMSVDTATSTKQLSDGMYMIESAGYHGADGLAVLQSAAEGAKVGNADLGDTANALTTILTDYHLPASDATAATNALLTTVADGKTHLQDLASSMGTVLPLASSLGISFPQVGGAIATMTNAGMPAQHAAQNLANTMRSLAAPNSAATKSMKEVGISAQDLKDTLANQGLPAAIQMVEDHVGKTFPAGSVEAVTAFKKIMGGATGYNTALMLGGQNMKTFEGNVSSISTAMNNGGSSVKGWSDVQKDFNFQAGQAGQAINVLMIKIGTALLPILSKLLSHITPLILGFISWEEKNHVVSKAIDAVKTAIGDVSAVLGPIISTIITVVSHIVNWAQQNHIVEKAIGTVKTAVSDVKNFIDGLVTTIKNVVQWFKDWHTPILVAAGAITAFFAPALIKAGAEAVINGVKIGAQFVANLAKTGAEAVINGAKITAQFVGSIIKAGVEGWQAAGKLALLIGSFIKSGVEAVAAGAKIAAQFVGSLILSGAQALINGAKIAASFVISLVSAGIQATISAGIMLATLVPALIATAVAALAAAAPFIIVGLIVAAVVIGIILAIQNWGAIMSWLQGVFAVVWGAIVSVWNGVVGFFRNIVSGVQGAFSGITSFFAGIGQGMWNGIKSGINWIIGGINSFIGFINGIHIDIPHVDVGPVHLGGGSIGLPHIPTIPLLAEGGIIAQAGRVIVGERGAEVLDLPAGAKVTPLAAGSSPTAFGAAGQGGTVINITINAPARTRNEAQEIAKMVMDELSRTLRQSGNLVTWTSGGRS